MLALNLNRNWFLVVSRVTLLQRWHGRETHVRAVASAVRWIRGNQHRESGATAACGLATESASGYGSALARRRFKCQWWRAAETAPPRYCGVCGTRRPAPRTARRDASPGRAPQAPAAPARHRQPAGPPRCTASPHARPHSCVPPPSRARAWRRRQRWRPHAAPALPIPHKDYSRYVTFDDIEVSAVQALNKHHTADIAAF